MKNNSLRSAGFIIASLLSLYSYGQDGRLADYNAIGWYVYNGDHKLTQKWELHTEYQWRRINFIQSWQQSLARVGLTYNVSDKVKLAGGYTNLITYPFGNYPRADQGVPYPEHRIYEDVQFSEQYGRVKLSHRFRLEQRFLGELSEENPRNVASWDFANRARYQISGEIPLKGAQTDDGKLYLNFFDELFIGFGPNVAQNIFDQNRISAGIGYQIRSDFQIELNFLNQIYQQPDLTNGKAVFEYNTGFRLNVNYNLDFAKK
ncbi:DUF2490 domain-containing protein [Spirosoma flavus]